MVRQTLNLAGVALPSVPDPTAKVPFTIRIGYAIKALLGQVHVLGPIDVSHVKDGRYMEGRLRVYLSRREAEEYQVLYPVVPD